MTKWRMQMRNKPAKGVVQGQRPWINGSQLENRGLFVRKNLGEADCVTPIDRAFFVASGPQLMPMACTRRTSCKSARPESQR